MTTIAVQLKDNMNRNVTGLFKNENILRNVFPDVTIRDKLGEGVIALDAEKKQLLFLSNGRETASCLVIDLNSLSGCSVTKEYSDIKAGDLKKNRLHKFLKNIFLNLRSLKGPVKLSVYNAQNDLHADVKLLESKAKKWQSIVARFLKNKVHNI